jgi:hypothetical protein
MVVMESKPLSEWVEELEETMTRDGLGQVRIEVIDLDQLDKLIKYFENRPHPNLRLRPYYRPIMVPEDNLEECFFDRL